MRDIEDVAGEEMCLPVCERPMEDEDQCGDGRALVKLSSCMRLYVYSACNTLSCGNVAGSPDNRRFESRSRHERIEW